ncbi:MAG: (d)CMP kinase [Candidatus Hydrogenedentes bacterium]|nr:(d)CMP kinase [Candidatus Hydrogenedentota bacterium]
MEPTQIVAIDGPAGAGKSSVARKVAERLGFRFLDTGAMYRAATWWAMHRGVDLADPDAVAAITNELPLEMREENGVLRVFVDGEDVTQAIRSPEVTRQIYRIDENARVREHLVKLQREYAARGPTVAEGRDMGTVVFPHAKCKIYLGASLDERTRRRQREMAEKGLETEFEQLREEIRIRDERTMTRAVAPLRRAPDAILVDTTGMSVAEVVATIVELARAKL